MTEEEKNGVVQEVINTIKGQSQDITELPVSDNIEDFTSLPAVGKDGRLKRFKVKELRKEFAGGSNVELVQEMGQSEDKAMSQKATTAAIAAATTTNDGKNLQEVYDATKSLTRTGQPSAIIDIAQELGEAADKPISQKAVSDVIAEIEKKARDNAEAIASMSASGGVPIAQEAGDSTTKVMSQAAVTKALKNVKATTDDGKTLEDVYQLTLETQTQNAPLEDFNLSDEGGNIILQLADGHIKTKNFDSRGYGNEGIAYVGGKVNLKKNTYNVTKIQHLPEGGGQGFAAYGDYAVVLRNSGVAGDFGANKGTAQIYRAIKGYNYSFVKHTDLFKLGQYENNHANCGSFGKKMNESDDFPLLYIPTINECKCTVEKIYLDGHSEKIQEISFSNFADGITKRSDLQWVTDGDFLYTFGHSKGWGLRGNKFLIARFDLPDTNGDKQLDMNNAHYLYYMEDYGFHNEIGTQGSIVHNGLLILPMGAGGDQKVTEAHLYVWDLNKRYMVCDLNLTKDKATKGEPEDVSIIEDDLYMLMANGDIYKFTF